MGWGWASRSTSSQYHPARFFKRFCSVRGIKRAELYYSGAFLWTREARRNTRARFAWQIEVSGSADKLIDFLR
jgi:hypothetical protein